MDAADDVGGSVLGVASAVAIPSRRCGISPAVCIAMRALCAISAFAVAAAARHAAGHRATGGAEIFIPSTDPAVTTVGRTIRNGDDRGRIPRPARGVFHIDLLA